jgi:hypothetical protein
VGCGCATIWFPKSTGSTEFFAGVDGFLSLSLSRPHAQSYSLGLIGWKLVTFGDADAASAELKKQCIEAKADLTSKGLKFD